MKFVGSIGFAETYEESPGNFQERITEIECKGDVLKDSASWSTGDQTNADLSLSQRIKIVASTTFLKDTSKIRFARIHGVAWSVTRIEMQHPSLLLYLGGVYNG